jgi:hypothetical protein
MKIITLEEHFQLAEIKKAVAKMLPGFACRPMTHPTPNWKIWGQIACTKWMSWASMSRSFPIPRRGYRGPGS